MSGNIGNHKLNFENYTNMVCIRWSSCLSTKDFYSQGFKPLFSRVHILPTLPLLEKSVAQGSTMSHLCNINKVFHNIQMCVLQAGCTETTDVTELPVLLN